MGNTFKIHHSVTEFRIVDYSNFRETNMRTVFQTIHSFTFTAGSKRRKKEQIVEFKCSGYK